MIGELRDLKVEFTAEQIAARVRALAGRISHDYRGRTVYAICILENAFIFMADLVRALDVPVVCQFVKPETRQLEHGTEIFYSPEAKVEGQDVFWSRGSSNPASPRIF